MEAPKLKSRFFKLRTARQFQFNPMYYDADKERMEERKQRIAKELEREGRLSPEDRLEMRASFAKRMANRHSARMERQSTIRLVVILLILIFFFLKLFGNLDALF